MEGVGGCAIFFFADAVKRIDTVLEYSRERFKNVFRGGKSDRQNPPTRSYRSIVGKGIDDRFGELCWLAGDDPVKIEQFQKMPIVDYYAILDKKIEWVLKQDKK